MKLAESKIKIHKTADFEESSFGIDDNEDLVHIFNILRNKIYTNKILAVIREYSTNAQDAHIEIGTPDRQIEVSVPTKLSPEFSVRDYGSGLTDDQVRNVYVKYGKSTKRNSNDFNGQLGLGCKAAFSYGDSFLITSYRNGLKNDYQAYIDESQIGKVAMLQSHETDEPNGIKITVPVKESDITSFGIYCKAFYEHFSPTPIGVKTVEKSYCISGEDWALTDDSSVHTGTKAIMGNVAYHVNSRILKDNTPTKIYQPLRGLCVNGLELRFDIGELGVASSREGLEYTKTTVKNIIEKLSKIGVELKAKIKNELNDAKDIFEAHAVCNELKTYNGKYYRFKDFIGHEDLVWNGNIIKEARFTFVNSPFDQGDDNLICKSITVNKGNITGVSQRTLCPHSRISAKNKNQLLINDGADKWTLRVRKHLEDTQIQTCYVFTMEGEHSKKQFEEFKTSNFLEDEHFIKLSTVDPIKSTKKRALTAEDRAKVFEFCLPTAKKADKRSWVPTDIDIKKPIGCHIVINRFEPLVEGSSITNSNLARIIEDIYTLSGEDLGDNLLGVKKSLAEKVGKTWPLFDDRVRSVYGQVIKEPELREILSLQRAIDSDYKRFWTRLSREKIWLYADFNKDMLGGLVLKLQKLSKFMANPTNSKKIDAIYRLQIYYTLKDAYINSRSQELFNNFKRILNEYPLLQSVGINGQITINQTIEYINMVDKYNLLLKEQLLREQKSCQKN